MKVRSIAECSSWSILQYFWPALSDNQSWKPILAFFLSGHLRQVLLCFRFSDGLTLLASVKGVWKFVRLNMAGLPIYSNVSRWVFSGVHSTVPDEQEYGYVNYIPDWNSAYMRPQPLPGYSQYGRVSGYFPPPPFAYETYPGYANLSSFYPKAMMYTGRAPGHPYEKIYDKPRGKDMQKQKRKQEHKAAIRIDRFRPDMDKKKHKSKSNKKIQMYRNWSFLEPHTPSESSYPVYMIPKRRLSYQNYMQESSFYGDEDDRASGSPRYHHWQYGTGLYRRRRGDNSSSSSRTSYQNHGADSDIEEEVMDPLAKDDKAIDGQNDAEHSKFHEHFQRSDNNQSHGSYEKEPSEKHNYENIQTSNDFCKWFFFNKNEIERSFRYSDTDLAKKNSLAHTESFRHSDTETARKNFSLNLQASNSADTKETRGFFYENIETSQNIEIKSVKDNVYENTHVSREETVPKRNVYENIQTPTDQEAGFFWKDIYENALYSGNFKDEIKRSEYQNIEKAGNTAYANANIVDDINGRENNKRARNIAYASTSVEDINEREHSERVTNTAYANTNAEDINEKEHSEKARNIAYASTSVEDINEREHSERITNTAYASTNIEDINEREHSEVETFDCEASRVNYGHYGVNPYQISGYLIPGVGLKNESSQESHTNVGWKWWNCTVLMITSFELTIIVLFSKFVGH